MNSWADKWVDQGKTKIECKTIGEIKNSETTRNNLR